LLCNKTDLRTTSCILAETIALLQSRLGIAAVRAFHNNAMPMLSVEWIDDELHEISMATTLGAARKNLSFVDSHYDENAFVIYNRNFMAMDSGSRTTNMHHIHYAP